MSDPQPKNDQSGASTDIAIMLSSVISKGLTRKHNHKRNMLGPETTDFVDAAVHVTVQLGHPAAKRSPGSLQPAGRVIRCPASRAPRKIPLRRFVIGFVLRPAGLHDTQCLLQGYGCSDPSRGEWSVIWK